MSLTLLGIEGGEGAGPLDGVHLQVGDGEAMALLGPTGEAKRVLLGVAGLALRPAPGAAGAGRGSSATLNGAGRPAGAGRQDPGGLRLIAWIAPPGPVGGDGEAMVGQVLGGPDWTPAAPSPGADVVAALASVGLSWAARQPVSALSPGELQRLAVARAFFDHPRVVLADDPTRRLDGLSALMVVQGLLRGLVEHAAPALVATEDEAVAALCHHVVEVRDGRVHRLAGHQPTRLTASP